MPRMSDNRLFSPRSWPIVAKLGVVLLLTAVAPLALAVAFAGIESRSALELKSRQNLELLAGVTASRLDQLINDTAATIRQIALDDAIIDLCEGALATPPDTAPFEASVSRKLNAVVTTNPDHASIFVLNRAGVGIAATSERNIGTDLSFREYVQKALQGEMNISDLLVGSTSHDPGVYFASPVKRADEVVGAVVLKLDGKRVWEMVDQVRFGTHGYAMLVNGRNIVIAIPNPAWLFHSTRPLTPEQVAQIDPKASYGLETINVIPVSDMQWHPATGTASFNAPLALGDSGETHWVAGYQSMKSRDWGVVVVEPAAQFAAPVASLLRTHAIIGIGVAVIAAFLAVGLAKSLVRPLVRVTDAANKLASGDMKARAPVYALDEIGALANAFNAMVPRLEEHVTLKQAMDVAVQVQQGLLPAGPPEHPKLDIFGRSIYCDATGGDYYDFVDVKSVGAEGGHRLLIALGDVMGHGIGSALLMASCRGALRAEAGDAKNLADMLTRVNRVIASDSQHGLFITLAILELDPPTSARPGSVRYASGGHDPTTVLRPDGTFIDLEGGGIPLGIDATSEYEEYRRDDLRPGDLLFIGTDGIWESRNPAGEMYGKDRMREVIRAHANAPLGQLGEAMEKDLIAFREGAPQHDDVTYVAIRLR